MSDQLDDFTHSKIEELSERGNQYLEAKQFDQAIDSFNQAIGYLQGPAEDWEAATWLFGSLGDAYFLSGRSQAALQPLLDAVKCPGGIGNPFLHLRLGQVQFDIGNEILAVDELTRAYMATGKRIFEGEDPKYFTLLTKVLRKPTNGW